MTLQKSIEGSGARGRAASLRVDKLAGAQVGAGAHGGRSRGRDGRQWGRRQDDRRCCTSGEGHRCQPRRRSGSYCKGGSRADGSQVGGAKKLAAKEYREPICPFCYAFANMRVPMVFDYQTGVWQCTHGNHTAANLEDDDEEAIRMDIMRMYDEQGADRRARVESSRYIKAMAGPVERRGGTKSGRKAKKPIKRLEEKPGTLV